MQTINSAVAGFSTGHRGRASLQRQGRWRAMFVLAVGWSLATVAPTIAWGAEPAAMPAEDYSHLKSLEVRVVGLDGEVIAGAKVTPRALGSSLGHGAWRTPDKHPEEPPTVVTDATGLATVPYPEFCDHSEESRVTIVTCRVSHPDYADVANEHVSVPQVAPFTIQLDPGATVMVQGMSEGEPVPEGELYVRWSSDPSAGPRPTVDDAGFTVLPKIGKGHEKIQLVRIPREGPLEFSRVIELELETGQEYPLIEDLQPGSTLSGKLCDIVPRPVRNGVVVARVITPIDETNPDFEHLGWSTWANINEDGTFQVSDLPQGWVQVIALCDGFAATSGAPPVFALEREKEQGGYIRPQIFRADDQGVTLDMRPTSTFEVHVVDSSGAGIEGVRIFANPNVGWWNYGSQIYCYPLFKSVDWLRTGEPPKPNLKAIPFHSVTDTKGRATIANIPSGGGSYENLELATDTEPSELVGEPHGYRIVKRLGSTTRKRIVIERPGE